jgi:N-acetylneuraminic acid mutarotase
MRFYLRLSALVVPAWLGTLACAGDQSPTGPERAGSPEASLASIVFPDKWVVGPDIPKPRYDLTAATVNGVIYVIGGWGTPGSSEGAVRHGYAYHPEITDWTAWRRMTPMPKARAATNGAVVIDGKIYVTGGVDSAGLRTKSLFVYDPATQLWSSGPNMPEPSSGGVSGAINGKLYVLVTPLQNEKAGFSRLYRFDPLTQIWSTRAASKYDHWNGTGRVIGGKFYVVGGGDDGTVRRELEVYDPATNSWTYKGLIPSARWGAASVALDGKLYVAGGRGPKGAKEWNGDVLEMYDPATNAWTAKRSMPTARWGAAGAVWKGMFYVIGGLGGDSRANEHYLRAALF